MSVPSYKWKEGLYIPFIELILITEPPPPFSMRTLGPEYRPQENSELAASIKELSRLKYGRERSVVEAEINERTKIGTSHNIIEEAKSTGEDFLAEVDLE